MNQVVVDVQKAVGLNDDDLNRVRFITSLEEQEEPVPNLEERRNSGFATLEMADFNVSLSMLHYKGYDLDFFTSWYNISSEIFREINRACPEKKVLNLALSVLVLPYIAFIAMRLAMYSIFKSDSKEQDDIGEGKKESEKTSVLKRFLYGTLAVMVIFINVVVLVVLVVPAIVALITFYLLNRDLFNSLVTVLKISVGQYSKKCQNLEVSFHEKKVSGSRIAYGMEIKFPSQLEQLLRGLCKIENDKWFNAMLDSEHNVILKLLANINLKNGLKPLRNEIRNVLETLIREFVRTIEELMKLERKSITHDKLRKLLNQFLLKVMSNIDSKLMAHLIVSAYRVAFIQAIKFQQKRRGEGFLLEDEIENILIKQRLESKSKELTSEKEIVIKDLKKARASVTGILGEDDFSVFKEEWKRFITKETMKDIREKIKFLKKEGQKRYREIRKKLKEIYDEGKINLTNGDLRGRLEDLFKFKCNNQEVKQKLVKSVVKKAKSELGLFCTRSLIDYWVRDLEEDIKSEREVSDKVNDFVEKVYLEVAKYKTLNLFKEQTKSIENLCKLLEKNSPDLVRRISLHRMRIKKYLQKPEQAFLLRKIIEGNKDLNKCLEGEQNKEREENLNLKLIEKHLENNQEILKVLKHLELKKEGLLINERATNDYREELESREKVKFAIIEDKLLEAFERETFDDKLIEELLERAELEYYFAEKCIKGPVVETKNNIKYFCQDLLTPVIDRLANLIINNVPKDNENGFWKIWNSLKVGVNYNVIGWSAAANKDNSIEGKALGVAHSAYKKIEIFLQCFHSSYEKVGTFLGNLFSDDGTTFTNNVWPKVEEHLCEMWDRFFRNVEFRIENKLDEVNVTQPTQITSITT